MKSMARTAHFSPLRLAHTHTHTYSLSLSLPPSLFLSLVSLWVSEYVSECAIEWGREKHHWLYIYLDLYLYLYISHRNRPWGGVRQSHLGRIYIWIYIYVCIYIYMHTYIHIHDTRTQTPTLRRCATEPPGQNSMRMLRLVSAEPKQAISIPQPDLQN